jgi:hypothetical protein
MHNLLVVNNHFYDEEDPNLAIRSIIVENEFNDGHQTRQDVEFVANIIIAGDFNVVLHNSEKRGGIF